MLQCLFLFKITFIKVSFFYLSLFWQPAFCVWDIFFTAHLRDLTWKNLLQPTTKLFILRVHKRHSIWVRRGFHQSKFVILLIICSRNGTYPIPSLSQLITWLKSLSLRWFLQYMKHHWHARCAQYRESWAMFHNSVIHISRNLNNENCRRFRFFYYLNNNTQLSSKLFLTKRIRIYIWDIINFIENHKAMIYTKQTYRKHFTFAHILHLHIFAFFFSFFFQDWYISEHSANITRLCLMGEENRLLEFDYLGFGLLINLCTAKLNICECTVKSLI